MIRGRGGSGAEVSVNRYSELPRPIFQIRPRMYVRRTIMYEIAAFFSPEEHA